MIAVQYFRRRMTPFALPILSIGALLYFGYHVLQGERGLKAWWTVNHRLEIAQFEHTRLRTERDRVEARVAMLRVDTLDRDMLDERLRVMLNHAQTGEIVIMYPQPLVGNFGATVETAE